MEDENGLELSLGLSCGGSSGKSKAPDASVDLREEGSTGKNESQKTETTLRQPENFWTNFGNASNDIQGKRPQYPMQKELWASSGKVNEEEEEKSSSSKRKLPFDDVLNNSNRKSPTAAISVKNSQTSAATEDGSCGENEEVAESEAEGSNSWLISQREDNSSIYKHVITDVSGKQAVLLGNESNQEVGKVNYGVAHVHQSMTVTTVPYQVPVKVPVLANATNTTVLSSPYFMQMETVVSSERPPIQGTNTSNVQLSFGYSQSQLPTLETSNSWIFGSNPQHITSASNKDHAVGLQSSIHPGKVSEQQSNPWDFTKGIMTGVGDAGTSSSAKPEHDSKAAKPDDKAQEPGYQTTPKGFIKEPSVIRPGVAPDVKFGGCGSYPDLPWVSTTGPGPNGKTISGVTYKYSKDRIKIVCACHGTHMTPDEFVQHARADAPDQENDAIHPTSNQAATTQT